MSCIELYRGTLFHFHLLSIENIADFVMYSSIRACVRVCVVMVGDGVDKFIQNQANGGGGGGGEFVNVAPLWTNYLKNQADFNRKHRLHR